MDKRNFFAVTSQQAGKYREDLTQEISKIFSEKGLTVKFCSFEGKNQLHEEVWKALKQGYYSFLAVGGDGTVNILASSLYNQPHRLGIIPVGTTNSLARVLGIPLTTIEAIKIAACSNNIRQVDGLEVDGRLLLMNVSVGLSSASLNNLNPQHKSKLGILAYLLGIIRNYKRVTRHIYQIQVNGALYHLRAVEMHVTNTGILGTPRFRIYRDSRIDDGQVEVLILRHWTIKEIFNTIIDLLINRKRQAIRLIAQGDDVLIQSTVPLPVQGDGDIIQKTPVRIKVLPRVVNFIVP